MWLAIRYRRVQASVLLVLSALITACVVLTPLYDRAMQQALTRLTLDSTPPGGTSIQVRSVPRATYSTDLVTYDPATLDQLDELLPDDARQWFGPRIDDISVVVVRGDLTTRAPVGTLEWRDGACEHVTWVTGGCPEGRGEIAVSQADVKNFGLRVGSTINVEEQTAVATEARPGIADLRVTGVYRQVRDAYWGEQVLTGVSGIVTTQPPFRPAHDTWLTSRATFLGPGAAAWLDPTNTVSYLLDRDRVGVDEVVRAGSAATGMRAASAPRVDDLGNPVPGSSVLADVQSDLPAIGERIDRGRTQALVTVPLLMSQLGLLALFVLALTLGAAVEQRRPEVAVARLRGAGRVGARRMVLGELLPVVLAGVPLGVGVALALAAAARGTVLRDAAPFELGPRFWLAIAGAAVLLAAVTWVTAALGTRDRIVALLRGVPTRTRGWRLGVADAVVIAVAGTAVVLVATDDLYGPAALAAPAMLALVVGLVLAQLIVPFGTWSARLLTARGRYAPALALLAVARRPATRRVVTVVTVASALLVFSTYAVSVGSRNRQLAAERDTGAPMVADLTGTDVDRVRTALAGADDGHATPVVRVSPGGGSFRTTLAVEPDDFARIALFPDSDPAAVPWSDLRPETGRRLSLTGTAVSVVVTPEEVTLPEFEDVTLRMEFLDLAGNRSAVVLGAIPGDRPRTLTGPVPCRAGCTVLGLSLEIPYGVDSSGRIRIGPVRATGGSTNLPGTAADWRGEVAGPVNRIDVRADATGPGLTVEYGGNGRQSALLTSRYFPITSPAVVVGSGTAGAVVGNGLDGRERSLTNIAELPRAPGVAGEAALVDLDLQRHYGARTGAGAQIQVWFDTEDPAVLERVRAALERAGVEIATVRRVGGARDAFDASVPAWSLQLGILAAVTGLLLAALVLVLLVASTWRRRSRDLACLGMTGVPARGLGRVAVGEQLPTVLVAALAGAGCGLLGAVLALPSMPLFAERREDLDLATPWLAVLAALAVAVVVLGLVTWLSGRAVAAAGARLGRIREAG